MSNQVTPCAVPPDTLLANCQRKGAYADCYVTEFERAIALPEYVEAFYTTPLFKVERLILRLLVSRPSSDLDAKALATGNANTFAAWNVEGRGTDQLLLADVSGKTRSWLMVEPASGGQHTRLYFGSAIIPGRNGQLGWSFRLLLGFHKFYSRALLRAARRRLANAS
jgi:hypothetical protein